MFIDFREWAIRSGLAGLVGFPSLFLGWVVFGDSSGRALPFAASMMALTR